MVLRDSEGHVILHGMPSSVEAVEAELCACRKGLELATEHIQLPIIIESDCT
jgi:hypothetical protein